MKKKLFSVFAIIVVMAIAITCLVACNPYKWDSIGGGDANAPVQSNGGYIVRQGNYVYYINGYVGADADSNWGNATKQGIARAEIDENGNIDNSTTKLLVPKSIYNTSKNGGIAIFGEWVYYATPNVDKDKNGTPSTTDTDFMRTKIDGSVTQKLGTIGTRSAEYIFTSTRVLYFTGNTISYIDFSGMNTTKNIDNAKGATTGTIAENVANVVWKYESDDIFFVQNAEGEESYKNYNNLKTCKKDGSGLQTLATIDTFLADGEEASATPLKVFKFNLLAMYVESDNSVTLYYVKTHTLDSTTVTDGLYCAKASDIKGEKLLNKTGSTTLFPLGFEDGALAYNSNSVYCWYNGSTESPTQVTTSSQTVWAVDAEKGIAYFTASSSAKALFKISYKTVDNAVAVFEEGIKTDWLKLEFIGDDFYFFATDDENFLHTVNVLTFDKTQEDAQSTYIGFERDEEEDEEKDEDNK